VPRWFSSRSDWRYGPKSPPLSGPSSQSSPSQPRPSRIARSHSSLERSGSVSSTRSRNCPPRRRARAQLNRAVRAPPMCSGPVGLGANRTRTVTGDSWELGGRGPRRSAGMLGGGAHESSGPGGEPRRVRRPRGRGKRGVPRSWRAHPRARGADSAGLLDSPGSQNPRLGPETALFSEQRPISKPIPSLVRVLVLKKSLSGGISRRLTRPSRAPLICPAPKRPPSCCRSATSLTPPACPRTRSACGSAAMARPSPCGCPRATGATPPINCAGCAVWSRRSPWGTARGWSYAPVRRSSAPCSSPAAPSPSRPLTSMCSWSACASSTRPASRSACAPSSTPTAWRASWPTTCPVCWSPWVAPGPTVACRFATSTS
jgi:hypothetical protein